MRKNIIKFGSKILKLLYFNEDEVYATNNIEIKKVDNLSNYLNSQEKSELEKLVEQFYELFPDC